MKLFISYSRVDTQFTYGYVARLRRMFPGSGVWFDEELHGGDNWWNAILDQIEFCDIFIYLLSNESLMSPYCRAELAEAQRLQKRIITVMVRPRTKIPPELSDIQYVDMKNGVDDPDALTNMSRAINYQRDNVPNPLLSPLWELRTPRPSSDEPQELSGEAEKQIHSPIPIDDSTGSLSPDQKYGLGRRGIIVGVIALIAVALIMFVIVLPKTDDPSVLQTAAALAMTNTQNAIASQTKTLTPTITPTRTLIPTPSPTATFLPLKNLTAFTTSVISPSNAAKIQPLGQLQIESTIKGEFGQIAWSSDGKFIAVTVNGIGVKVFSVLDLAKPIQTLKQFGRLTGVAFSPDQKYLVSTSSYPSISIWNFNTGELIRSISDGGNAVAYSPDGRYILATQPNFKLGIWQAYTGRLIKTIDAHTTHITGVAYSPDGRYFVSSSMDKTVKVWDANSGENLFTLNGDPYCAMAVAYSPDRGTILNGGCDNLVKLWNAASGKLIFAKTVTNTVSAVTYNPASSLFVGGDANKDYDLECL